MKAHELADDYIRRLKAAASGMPESRRAELVGEIREHIMVASAESPMKGEAAMCTILDRLGEPEEIVREAGGQAARPADSGLLGGGRAVAALVIAAVLTLSNFVVPLAVWALGAVIAWLVLRWPTQHKLLALVVWPIGAIGAWFVGPGASGDEGCMVRAACSSTGVPVAVQMGLGLAAVLAAIATTIVIFRRERRPHEAARSDSVFS